MVSGRLWKFNIYRWFSINHVLSGFSHLIIKIPYFENLAHLKVKYDKFIEICYEYARATRTERETIHLRKNESQHVMLSTIMCISSIERDSHTEREFNWPSRRKDKNHVLSWPIVVIDLWSRLGIIKPSAHYKTFLRRDGTFSILWPKNSFNTITWSPLNLL